MELRTPEDRRGGGARAWLGNGSAGADRAAAAWPIAVVDRGGRSRRSIAEVDRAAAERRAAEAAGRLVYAPPGSPSSAELMAAAASARRWQRRRRRAWRRAAGRPTSGAPTTAATPAACRRSSSRSRAAGRSRARATRARRARSSWAPPALATRRRLSPAGATGSPPSVHRARTWATCTAPSERVRRRNPDRVATSTPLRRAERVVVGDACSSDHAGTRKQQATKVTAAPKSRLCQRRAPSRKLSNGAMKQLEGAADAAVKRRRAHRRVGRGRDDQGGRHEIETSRSARTAQISDELRLVVATNLVAPVLLTRINLRPCLPGRLAPDGGEATRTVWRVSAHVAAPAARGRVRGAGSISRCAVAVHDGGGGAALR